MIYILEDDDSIRKLVTYALESQGYRAAGFAVPSAFYEELEKRVPSLLLLDIMLPEEDGISILRKLRANPRTADLPVIMLTAKSTEYDHVEGLDAGADDYVAKPFGMMELLARVRAVLRRAADASVSKKTAGIKADVKNSDYPAGMKAGAEGSAGAAASAESNALLPGSSHNSSGLPARGHDVLEFGILRIYPKRYEVFVEDEEISLTNKEYQLLLLLVENEGLVMTREILLDRFWDLGSEPENRTLDVHIRKIRSKLGDAAVWIETIRGVGYRFRPV